MQMKSFRILNFFVGNCSMLYVGSNHLDVDRVNGPYGGTINVMYPPAAGVTLVKYQ